MPLQIIRNDITKVEADAIVNTANPHPVIGGGTDSAIYEAAGKERLLAERRKIGDIAPGYAAVTSGFDLPSKYIIHTVGPAWVDGQHREEQLLHMAYDAALHQADQLRCKTVAFPLMAAGSYGFPQELALSIAINTFTDFLMDRDMTIYLVLFNRKAFSLASSLFSGLRSYIDDNYVEEQTRREYSSPQERRGYSSPQERRGYSSPQERREYSSPQERRGYSSPQERRGYGSPQEQRRRLEDTAQLKKDEIYNAETLLLNQGMVREQMDEAASFTSASAGSLREMLGQSESTFSEFLLELLKARDGKDSEVYKRAEVSKQLFSKILSNKYYQPTKNTVVQLAIGLQLDLSQTQKLLGKAGYTLTRSSKADLVVQYYIEHKIYNVAFINIALDECGLPLLKTGLKA